jgi:predicted transcriptional regulator
MELTKAEEQIMRVVWNQEPLFIKDLIENLPDPKPAYNTVGTFLKILEDKGFVSRKKYGNSFEYSSVISKSAYTAWLLKSYVRRFFEGSPEKMLSHFMDQNDLDLKTVEEMQKKLKDE